MTEPAFTVIVAAYAAERHVAAAVESVIRQSRSDWELVIVDDGSPSPLRSHVEPFLSDIRIRLLTQKNAGPGAARNHAARESRGRYLTMLDSDDMLLPDYLAAVGAVLDTRPEVGLVGTDAHVLVERTGRVRRRSFLKGRHVDPPRRLDPRRQLERLLHHSFIPSMATIRRDVFDKVGGYDPDRELPEDWDLNIRLAASGTTIELLRRPLAVHRIREDSRSRSGGIEQLDRARELTALKALRELKLSPAEQRAAQFVVNDSRRRMALARARETLLDGQFQFSRAAARSAFRARPTLKGAVLVGALGIAPRSLTWMHSAKTSFRGMVSRVVERNRPGGLT